MKGLLGRRAYLKMAGSGLILGPCTGMASAQGGPDKLARQFEEVRAATRSYRDVRAARSDGYTSLLGYFPEMGFHFTAPDGPLGAERAEPPVLVYFTTGSYDPDPGDLNDPDRDDDLVLGGVEYLVPGDKSDEPPNIFADESSEQTLQVTEAEGWHFEADLNITALHAWIHRWNPAGVFHPTNPTID